MGKCMSWHGVNRQARNAGIGAGYADVYPALYLSEQTTPTSPPNPLLLNAYNASLFTVTVRVNTNGHKAYHLLDGMNKLILI